MSDKLMTHSPSPLVEAGPKSGTYRRLHWTAGIAAVAIAAASVTVMVCLIYAPGLAEGAAVVIGITALAAGIAYTLQRFLRGPVKCHRGGDDEEI